MKKKSSIKILLIVLGIMLMLPVAGCGAFNLYLDHIGSNMVNSLEQDRPDVSAEYPELTDTITDVRMTVISRHFEPVAILSDDNDERDYLQIYYGYCDDGVWTDLPCENFDLIGIFNCDGTLGWNAAMYDHIVKMGPYLLVCITAPGFPDLTATITDSLDSQVYEPFAKYCTEGYGCVSECILPTKSEDDVAVNYSEVFWPRYYLLLDYESLPDDYVLNVEKMASSYSDSYELTMEQIRNLIA